MICPFCNSDKISVIDSRDTENNTSVRRRRECDFCNRRFTTYEKIDLRPPKIVKRDGRREDFNEKKISKSLELALRKREVDTTALDRILNIVSAEVMSSDQKELPSRKIGEIIMQELYNLDAVAFIRYASVYKNFADVDEFSTALQSYFSQEPQLPGLEQQKLPQIK